MLPLLIVTQKGVCFVDVFMWNALSRQTSDVFITGQKQFLLALFVYVISALLTLSPLERVEKTLK